MGGDQAFGVRLRLGPGEALVGDPLGLTLSGPLFFLLFGLCLSPVSQEICFGADSSWSQLSLEDSTWVRPWASWWPGRRGSRSILEAGGVAWPGLESTGKPGGAQGPESVAEERERDRWGGKK